MGGDPARGETRFVPSVLIVDDHAGFRASARRMIEAEGWRVVGEAGSAAAGLRAAADLQPDLVLLDVHLPDVSGLAVASTLTSRPGAPGVVLTSSRDASDFEDRIPSGALGFVPKGELSTAALAALLP